MHSYNERTLRTITSWSTKTETWDERFTFVYKLNGKVVVENYYWTRGKDDPDDLDGYYQDCFIEDVLKELHRWKCHVYCMIHTYSMYHTVCK